LLLHVVNTHALVGNTDDHAAIFLFRRYANRRLRMRVLSGILQQLDQNFLDAIAI
jgi:hypothetical protein